MTLHTPQLEWDKSVGFKSVSGAKYTMGVGAKFGFYEVGGLYFICVNTVQKVFVQIDKDTYDYLKTSKYSNSNRTIVFHESCLPRRRAVATAAASLIKSLSVTNSLKRFGRGVYFHLTSWKSARSIVEEHTLRLVPAIANKSERDASMSKYDYYASFARTPTSGFFHAPRGVIIVFDAPKLKAKHKIRPVDYWERMWLKGREVTSPAGQLQTRESEDRIFSSKPQIKLPKGTVKEVHVQYQAVKDLPKLVIACKKLKIPVYVHKDVSTFKALSIDPKDMMPVKGIGEGEKKRRAKDGVAWPKYDRTATKIEAIINLIHAKKYSNLGKNTTRLAYHWMPGADIYKSDFINGLSADIHNDKNGTDKIRRQIATIISFMKKNKFDYGELYEFLAEKFERLSNDHYAKETANLKAKPADKELWDKLEEKAKKRFKKWPCKKGMDWLIEKYKDEGGTFTKKQPKRDKQKEGYDFIDGDVIQPAIDEKPVTVACIYSRLNALKG